MISLKTILSNIYRYFFPLDQVTMFKRMGVKIGDNCKIMNEVMIDYSHYWLIKIGDNVTIAPRVHILAHDASTKSHLGYTKLKLVEIKNNVFIGAGSIILPGVTIGENAVIGAGSIVNKDIPDNCIAVGNPAKVIGTMDNYLQIQRAQMNNENCFNESYTLRGSITEEKKIEMIAFLEKHKIGFVV